MTSAYKTFAGKPGGDNLEDKGVDERITLKFSLKKLGIIM
jgi:hypothetical protein